MKSQSIGQLALAAAAVAYLIGVYFASSPVWMGFTINALIIAVVAMSWNITGGFGGLSSFGHAALYGTGAYASAILQVKYGVNAWVGFAAGILAGAAMGAFIGALAFRYGLRGSYFALVTLAFAEVLRICASSFEFSGGGSGLQLKLAPGLANLQFADRTVVYTALLVVVAVVMILTALIKYSRFGAYLIAVRENEDAARALGIDTYRIKVQAMAISGAFGGLAGVLYLQLWLFIDSTVVYGSAVSVEALIGPIIGGAGTVWGPLLGTLGLHLLGEGAKHLLPNAPGLNFVLYAVVLICALRFLPQGLVGLAGKFGAFTKKKEADDA
ncbi:branched-chain amino acid ABC transporter permease [Rhizobium rhizoryzae]|uniref:Branched-chain amino acid transport system permease protein n=1 Tax=Rhizobium rhizoryzae TaxID=451876 RepID=A0A7W6LKV9_9HYPH|nr:branched-chain amino acid ABC transporter permease [Rhizobium rhizoryzae]MBB4145102.1 branched-chain amino acid transport system permease protein [Rhizobium rhizoryzae]